MSTRAKIITLGVFYVVGSMGSTYLIGETARIVVFGAAHLSVLTALMAWRVPA